MKMNRRRLSFILLAALLTGMATSASAQSVTGRKGHWEKAISITYATQTGTLYDIGGNEWEGNFDATMVDFSFRYHTSDCFSIGAALTVGYSSLDFGPVMLNVSLKQNIRTDKRWTPYVTMDLGGGLDFSWNAFTEKVGGGIGVEYLLNERQQSLFVELNTALHVVNVSGDSYTFTLFAGPKLGLCF